MDRLTTVSGFQPRRVLLAIVACGAWPGSAVGDIVTSGVVTPPEVTTGIVSGPVVLGDFSLLQPGTLTIDNGSSLIVNDTNPFGGISVNVPGNMLNVSSAFLSSSAGVALNVDRDSNVVIDAGSLVSLTGAASTFPSTALLIGSRGGAGVVSSVNVDGTSTELSLTGAVGIASLTGFETAELNVSNGATVLHDGVTSQVSGSFGGFVIGGNGSVGELSLVSSATLQSSVPQTIIGRGLGGLAGFGTVQLAGSSLYEVSTAMTVGLGGGAGTVSLDNSTMRVFADVGVPTANAGSVFLAIGDSTSVGSILMDNSSVTEVEGSVYISHDGTTGSGLGSAVVSVCDSALTATDVVIGENGTLAGTTINANVIVDGGTVSPGCSPGVMTVNGDVTFAGGELVIELVGPGNLDVLQVAGTTEIQPGTTITLSFQNGYAPSAGDNIDFINSTQLVLPPEPAAVSYAVDGLLEGFDFDVSTDGAGLNIMANSDAAPVSVDPALNIRPWIEPNYVIPGSFLPINVAILTTNDAPIFDATTVDPETVRFGPDGASAILRRTRHWDVDGDGDLDMLLSFRNRDTGIACGDTSAALTGETLAGTTIAASDSIETIFCH